MIVPVWERRERVFFSRKEPKEPVGSIKLAVRCSARKEVQPEQSTSLLFSKTFLSLPPGVSHSCKTNPFTPSFEIQARPGGLSARAGTCVLSGNQPALSGRHL